MFCIVQTKDYQPQIEVNIGFFTKLILKEGGKNKITWNIGLTVNIVINKTTIFAFWLSLCDMHEFYENALWES